MEAIGCRKIWAFGCNWNWIPYVSKRENELRWHQHEPNSIRLGLRVGKEGDLLAVCQETKMVKPKERVKLRLGNKVAIGVLGGLSFMLVWLGLHLWENSNEPVSVTPGLSCVEVELEVEVDVEVEQPMAMCRGNNGFNNGVIRRSPSCQNYYCNCSACTNHDQLPEIITLTLLLAIVLGFTCFHDSSKSKKRGTKDGTEGGSKDTSELIIEQKGETNILVTSSSNLQTDEAIFCAPKRLRLLMAMRLLVSVVLPRKLK